MEQQLSQETFQYVKERIFAICMCLDACDNAITEINGKIGNDAGDLAYEVNQIKTVTSAFIQKMGESMGEINREKVGTYFDNFYKDAMKQSRLITRKYI